MATERPQTPIGQIAKIPTLKDLIKESDETIKDNQFMVLLNQPPPDSWLHEHPIVNGYKYLPISRVEYLLSRIFTKWWVEIIETKLIANSVVIQVRLFVRNPITLETEHQDGIGATPIQTDKGSGASDWNAVKSDGVMKAAPAAESYAIKDAAEKFGKLFGKDLGRRDLIAYDSILQDKQDIPYVDLKMLFELKKDSLNTKEITDAMRILNNKEKDSYNKLQKILSEK